MYLKANLSIINTWRLLSMHSCRNINRLTSSDNIYIHIIFPSIFKNHMCLWLYVITAFSRAAWWLLCSTPIFLRFQNSLKSLSTGSRACWMFLIYCWMFLIWCWMFLIYCWMFLIYCWMFLMYSLMFLMNSLMFLINCWMF